MIAQRQSITHDPRLLSWDGTEARPDGPVSQVRAVGHVLTTRWRLIAAFVVAGVAGMAVVTLLTERRYTATAVVHIENDMPHVTKIDQVVAAPSYLESVEYFQDQVSLLKSRTLMAAVIRNLDLKDDPRFLPAPPGIAARASRALMGAIVRLGGTPPPPPERAGAEATENGVPTSAIDRYAVNLEVKPIANSRLVQVHATARDPDLAQAIANAHANEYIRRTLQAKFELTGEARKYLDREIERVRQEADTSEATLDRFRREHGIVAADDAQGNAVVERLQDLSRRLTNAQAQRIEFEAQHSLVQNRDFE